MGRKLGAVETPDSPDTAFEQFITPYFGSLYGRAYRLTRNVEDAEDLVQDLCLRAYGAFDDLKNMNNPTAWLLRVLYRLFVDQIRRHSSSPVRLLTRHEAEEGRLEAVSPEPGPAESAEAALLGGQLDRALRLLRPEDQALLVLHEVEGYSLAEIEQITGLPPSTMKSRLQRSRIKLGRLLRSNAQDATDNVRGSQYELPRRHQSIG